MRQDAVQNTEKQTETARAIGENVITAGATYVAERLKDASFDYALLSRAAGLSFRPAYRA